MITFIDGPAKGIIMHLLRAPLLLRVTTSVTGEFDALDQVTDEPLPEEQIYVYRRQRKPNLVHVNGAKSVRGFYLNTEYKYEPVQPPDHTMRNRTAWQQWARDRARIITNATD